MLTIIRAALEAGFLYAPVAMALFLSFSILNIADMTTDGAFVLGSAVSAMMCLSGHPVLALPAGMLAAAAAGFITAFLQTKLSVPSILAGIITNIGLYSVNLMVMGKSNQSLFQTDTIYTLAKGAGFAGSWYKLAVTALIVLALAAALVLFLGTRLGLSVRATGDNMDMVRASSINTNFTITVGLCIANGCTALSGGSLQGRLEEACAAYGAQRLALDLERLMMDFPLPCPSGEGIRLSREELSIRMQGRSVFYAEDLSARYFTYRRGGQTHFVLFDDAGTLRRKIEMGQALGIREGFVMLPEVEDLTGFLFTGEG